VPNSGNILDHLPPIILASSSARRKALLQQIGVHFRVQPSNVNEDFSINLPAESFATHYAEQKAKEMSERFPSALVIGADTIVVLNNEIMGKPKNKLESQTMLSKLSGQSHRVMTGVSLQVKQLNIDHTFLTKTQVTFKPISNREIEYYIEKYQPFDKAGSYGIQDWFSVFVERIEGCFYNVVGFPLSAFYREINTLFGD